MKTQKCAGALAKSSSQGFFRFLYGVLYMKTPNEVHKKV